MNLDFLFNPRWSPWMISSFLPAILKAKGQYTCMTISTYFQLWKQICWLQPLCAGSNEEAEKHYQLPFAAACKEHEETVTLASFWREQRPHVASIMSTRFPSHKVPQQRAQEGICGSENKVRLKRAECYMSNPDCVGTSHYWKRSILKHISQAWIHRMRRIWGYTAMHSE